MNALTYLTRRCPRTCDYCRLRDSNLKGPELTTEQWIEAFAILKKIGVDFNLILGNETWLLGEELLKIMKTNEVPYALYTTCPESLFSKYRDLYFSSGVIDNLSCGVDYSYSFLQQKLEKQGQFDTDMERKSYTAWQGLMWVRKQYPNVDCQGTMTISKDNFHLLPAVVKELQEIGVFCGVNFLHWNSDGNFDFFPDKKELVDYVLSYVDILRVKEVINNIPYANFVQNYEMLKQPVEKLANMSWHCMGDPYGGPSIDSDGTLRCCGYRQGKETSKFSIFDLPEKFDEWRSAVFKDSFNCPGCFWSYPWMYRYWADNDSEFGKKVFVKHAGKHIDENSWSSRQIEG